MGNRGFPATDLMCDNVILRPYDVEQASRDHYSSHSSFLALNSHPVVFLYNRPPLSHRACLTNRWIIKSASLIFPTCIDDDIEHDHGHDRREGQTFLTGTRLSFWSSALRES